MKPHQVPKELQPTLASLKRLVETLASNKREADDNSRRIGILFWKLNAGEVKREVQDKLVTLVAALESGNLPNAERIQVDPSARLVLVMHCTAI
jgi:protein transport protein SEC31